MKTIGDHDFERDVGAAMRTAADQPVIIEADGKPAFVLISYAEYRRLRAAHGDQTS